MIVWRKRRKKRKNRELEGDIEGMREAAKGGGAERLVRWKRKRKRERKRRRRMVLKQCLDVYSVFIRCLL